LGNSEKLEAGEKKKKPEAVVLVEEVLKLHSIKILLLLV
jgi:hypothetical protein